MMHMKAVKTLSGDIDDEPDEVENSKGLTAHKSNLSNDSDVRPGSRTESEAEIIQNSMTRMTTEEFRSGSNRSRLDQFHSTSTQLTADNNIVLGMFKARQKVSLSLCPS